MDKPYGYELIVDLHGSDPKKMTRRSIKKFTSELCEIIGMEAEKLTFWDDRWVWPWNRQTNPKTTGISAVRFIITSNITIHTLPKLRKVYINVFSCKEFCKAAAAAFCKAWFKGQIINERIMKRM